MKNRLVFLKLSVTTALLLGVLICCAQTTLQLDKDTSKFKENPLYVLKLSALSAFPTSNLVINTTAIDSINVYKSPVSVELYGKSAANGVVELVLKRGTKIINFNELLTAFKIASSDSDLQVFIDSAIAYQPTKTYFEPAAIKYVKVEIEKNTGMRYISIRSIYALKRPLKDSIYIRGK